MPYPRPHFSLRGLVLVLCLTGVSMGLLRLGYVASVPNGIDHFSGGLLILGAHLFVGTIGASVGGLTGGRDRAVKGAVIALGLMWVVAFLLPSMVH